MDDKESPITFTYGTHPNSKNDKSDKPVSENVFLKPVTLKPIAIETYQVKTEFRQSNKSREFIEGDDEKEELNYIKIGSVLHHVFSTIRTHEDIPQALSQLQHDGILYDDEVTREKVTKLLQKRLSDQRVSIWFSKGWSLFNECTILSVEDGKILERRPDRVITNGQETHVIDFKFGKPNPEYHQQVKEYMDLICSMGLPNVHGWLWYVYSNKIEEVK